MKKKVTVNDLARSCNETLVLALLLNGKKHGYQMAIELEKNSESYFRLTYGTLYPVLHKLEKLGLIKGEWEAEETQRKRKFYMITGSGRKHLETMKSEWRKFNKQLFKILEG